MADKDLYVVIAEMLRKQDQQSEILERIDSTLEKFMGLALQQFEKQLKFNERLLDTQKLMSDKLFELSSVQEILSDKLEKLSDNQEKLSDKLEKLSDSQEMLSTHQEKMGVTQSNMAKLLEQITDRLITDSAEVKSRLAKIEEKLN